jgi:hypothetical protein
MVAGCTSPKSKKKSSDKSVVTSFSENTYGYDRQFIEKYHTVVELKNGDAALVIVPDFQGRVMTSTCEGDAGAGFGWINHDLIASKKTVEHINVFGGEERFWIGPEGGQYSIYFAKEKDFVFENWFVPASIDTEPFQVIDKNETAVTFSKDMHLVNYSGTPFNLNINRKVSLLTTEQVMANLSVEDKSLAVVAYESANIMKNNGDKEWTKESGLLSIWMLSMFNPSPDVTIVIPVKEGSVSELGTIVNDDYFGKISSDRLKVKNNTVFFKGDGKSRGKIGISPLRATRFMGSYDAHSKVLTILECELPEGTTDFVNSAWKLQDNPFGGDALNSYNDGPLEDGSQLGPFYELESSSPALALKPGAAYTHTQRIYHIKGDEKSLNKVSEKILNVSLSMIEGVFGE